MTYASKRIRSSPRQNLFRFVIVAAICLLISSITPDVHATKLYDFTKALSDPHPFSNPTLIEVPVWQPVTDSPSDTSFNSVSAYRALPGSVSAKSGLRNNLAENQFTAENRNRSDRNFYTSFFLIGSFGIVNDISINNGNTLEIRHDQDFVAGAGLVVGYSRPKELPLRAELEYHYRYRMVFDFRDIDTPGRAGYENNLSTHAIFLNTYLDYVINQTWTIYGGGGIGWVRNVSDVSRSTIDVPGRSERTDETNNFGWNIALGTLWRFSKSGWLADFRYRYIDLGDVSSGPHVDGAVVRGGSYTSHEAIIGLMYKF